MWIYVDKNIVIHVLGWRMDECGVKGHKGVNLGTFMAYAESIHLKNLFY
jgi:hypothetical protein